MTTLITGGAGFIGSHLAAQLLNQGESVVILDNFNDFYDVRLKRANVARLGTSATIVEGDIRDTETVEKLFREHDLSRVAHLAALANVRRSMEIGDQYADVNTTGSVNLMNIARKHHVSVFVQASTSSVYGQTTRIPFVEDDAPDFPLAPYPASKRAAEIFAYTYHQLYNLNVTILRFFNVYGPNGRPDMMPLRVIDSLMRDEPIPIFDEGRLERDWTYIDDIVNGVVAALNRPMGYTILNLGYGAPISLTRFIEIYETLVGKKAIRQLLPAPASEPRITFCNNNRARQLLGFDPKVGIEEGLARTWEWYRTTRLSTR